MCRAVSEVRSWRGGGVARTRREASWSNRTRWRKLRSIQTRDATSGAPDRTSVVLFWPSLRTRRNPSGYSVFKYTVRGNHHATSGRLRVIISAVTACHSTRGHGASPGSNQSVLTCRVGLTEARAASPRCVYTASLARLHALGNISTSRLTAPSLALSPPQFMRVGAVAVGLGYGAVMGTFTGLVRHTLGSPPLGAESWDAHPRAREDHRPIAVKDHATIRGFLNALREESLAADKSSAHLPSLPDLSPRAVQKVRVSAAAVDVQARAVPAVTHRA